MSETYNIENMTTLNVRLVETDEAEYIRFSSDDWLLCDHDGSYSSVQPIEQYRLEQTYLEYLDQ